MNIAQSEEEMLQRLEKGVGSKTGFALFICLFTTKDQREHWIGKVSEQCTAIEVVRIGRQTRDSTQILFEDIRRKGKATTAVHVVGMEDWPKGFDDLLARINNRRNALPNECPCPIIVWLRHEHANKMAKEAGDVWAWRSAVFDLESSEERELGYGEVPSVV